MFERDLEIKLMVVAGLETIPFSSAFLEKAPGK
jgi:hypothetical protein